MTKAAFLKTLGEAYDFPDYYTHNLDSADEILAERQEERAGAKESLRPFFVTLLSELEAEEREGLLALLEDYFVGLES